MALPDVKISGRGMEVTDPIRSYILEKLKKHEPLFEMATAIEAECYQNISARGVKQDFRVEISVTMPRTLIRVEKYGSDVYAIVDQVVDVLLRKVKRYKDKLRKWEGKESWKMAEANGAAKDDADTVEETLVPYDPKIVKRKKIENCTPVTEEEAIERMEMMGYDSFLFKNKKTGKFSMVYRRRNGWYGIVEPCED